MTRKVVVEVARAVAIAARDACSYLTAVLLSIRTSHSRETSKTVVYVTPSCKTDASLTEGMLVDAGHAEELDGAASESAWPSAIAEADGEKLQASNKAKKDEITDLRKTSPHFSCDALLCTTWVTKYRR